MKSELTVVMPVYNEEDCIGSVVERWRDVLKSVGADFSILVLNDGSTDGTADVLERFADADDVEVVHAPNAGHGPAVLRGYRAGVARSEWVFQVDGDDEIDAAPFPLFWQRRHEFDALLGTRVGRRQGPARMLVTWASRAIVRLRFGQGIRDVNSPYRLMRSDILEKIILQIPDDTFAPNLLVSGALARGHTRIFEWPVRHRVRATGVVSIAGWKLARAAARSFVQTLSCRPDL